jgi:hypothetical protein
LKSSSVEIDSGASTQAAKRIRIEEKQHIEATVKELKAKLQTAEMQRKLAEDAIRHALQCLSFSCGPDLSSSQMETKISPSFESSSSSSTASLPKAESNAFEVMPKGLSWLKLLLKNVVITFTSVCYLIICGRNVF